MSYLDLNSVETSEDVQIPVKKTIKPLTLVLSIGGALLVIGGIVGLVIFLMRKKNSSSSNSNSDSDPSNNGNNGSNSSNSNSTSTSTSNSSSASSSSSALTPTTLDGKTLILRNYFKRTDGGFLTLTSSDINDTSTPVSFVFAKKSYANDVYSIRQSPDGLYIGGGTGSSDPNTFTWKMVQNGSFWNLQMYQNGTNTNNYLGWRPDQNAYDYSSPSNFPSADYYNFTLQ